MKQSRKLISAILLASGLGALAAGPVLADEDCMSGGGHRHERFAKHMEQHHKMLHDALKLTPEQEPGWKKLLDSEQHGPMPGAAPREDLSKLTAPERAEKHLEMSKQHQERMSEHVTALKAFYATLTPEQKKTFDEFHAGPRKGMGGKMEHRHPADGEPAPAKR